MILRAKPSAGVRGENGRPSTSAETGGVVVRDLTFRYRHRDSEKVVFENLGLSVRPGEFFSIVGPSGCGKSTLLMLLAGLAKHDAGEITIGGSRVTRPSRDVGVVFQQPALLPWRTALANVAWGLRLKGESRREAKRRALEALRLVGLEDYADQYPARLSGGMQQRVSLARALALDITVLLLDEPFAALDAQTREIMQQYLLALWDREKTVILVTHQIDEAVYLSDRVLVFNGSGEVLREVTVDFARPRRPEIKTSPEFSSLVHEIWTAIEADVVKAAALGGWFSQENMLG